MLPYMTSTQRRKSDAVIVQGCRGEGFKYKVKASYMEAPNDISDAYASRIFYRLENDRLSVK